MDFLVSIEMDKKHYHSFSEGKYELDDYSESSLTTVSLDITLGDYEVEERPNIGKALGYLGYNDEDFADSCDVETEDLNQIALAICSPKGYIYSKYVNSFDKVFILDHIEINEAYRNKGITTAILKNIFPMLENEFSCPIDAVVLNASDFISAREYGFDSEEYKKGTKRLIKFYKRLGFKVAKGSFLYLNRFDEEQVSLHN